MKKAVSILMVFILVLCGMSLPLNANAAQSVIQVALPAQYNDIHLKQGETQIYEVTATINGEEKLGLVDANGVFITPCQWKSIGKFGANGLALVQGGNGYGAINRSGIQVIEAKYGFIEEFEGDYAKVYKNGKYGFVNSAGVITVPIIWNQVSNFSENMAPVKNDNGLWGYINTSGALVIACTYTNAAPFKGGLGWVVNAQNHMGAINASGQTVVDFQFEPNDTCCYFHGPLFGDNNNMNIAAVRLIGQTKYCFVDKSGNMVTQSTYDSEAVLDENGTAIVMVNGQLGVIKQVLNGNTVTVANVIAPANYRYIDRAYTNSHALFFNVCESVNDIDVYTLYNLAGTKIVTGENIRYVAILDLWDVLNDDDLHGYYQSNGTVAVPTIYRSLIPVSDNLIVFKKDVNNTNKCGFINKQGQVSPTLYDNIGGYSSDNTNDYFNVLLNGKWGVVDKNLETVVPIQYDAVKTPTEGMGAVKKGTKWGFYDLTGKAEKYMIYRDVSYYSEGLAWVSESTKAGAINKSGVYVISPEWTPNLACNIFEPYTFNNYANGVAAVQNKASGKFAFIDKVGEKVTNYEFSYASNFDDNNISLFKEGDLNGMLKLSAPGATITATGVTVDVTNVTIFKDSFRVVTETVLPVTATNKEVVYTSNNLSVATVSPTGIITGQAAGVAVVKVALKLNPSIYKQINVTVVNRPAGLTLHSKTELVPVSAWEGQDWLINSVMTANEYTSKDVATLTYGDLLKVYDINVDSQTILGQVGAVKIPNIIAQFSNLIFFSADGIPFQGAIPDAFGYLSNLQLLSITNANLNGISTMLTNCDNLTKLDISYNTIDTSDAAYISIKSQLLSRNVEVVDNDQKVWATSILPDESEIKCIEGGYGSIYLTLSPDSWDTTYTYSYIGTGSIELSDNGPYLYYTALTSGTGDIVFYSNGAELARVAVTIESKGDLITSSDIPDPVLLQYLTSLKGDNATELYAKDLMLLDYLDLSYNGVNGTIDWGTTPPEYIYKGEITDLHGLDNLIFNGKYIYAENQSLTAIDGLANMSNATYVNLSCNYITQIKSSLPPLFYTADNDDKTALNLSRNNLTSLVGLEGIKNCFIDLTYNDIDFETPSNSAVLSQLQDDGCIVDTDNQLSDKTYVYTVGNLVLDASSNSTSTMFYTIYPRSIESQLTVEFDNDSVATLVNTDHMQLATVKPLSFGSTNYQVKLNGKVLGTGKIIVPDPQNPLAPEVTQYTLETETCLQLLSDICMYAVQYKVGSDGTWTDVEMDYISSWYQFNITDQGTIFIRYQSSSDVWSPAASILVNQDYNVQGENLYSYLGSGGNVIIPSNLGITNLNWAFSGLTNITSISIPRGVTSIKNSEFEGCTNLTSVTIPNSVTSIGDWAFNNCTNLTSVTIPNSVTSIGEFAFYNFPKTFKIYGKSGSYAQTYAAKYKIQFVEVTPETFTVTFNSNGGSTVNSQTVDGDTAITAPPAPTKAGYTFIGWFTSDTDGTKIIFPYTITEDTTMYAHWTANYIPGDINGDNTVDLLDATALSRTIAGWQGISVNTAALDVTGDGNVDLLDITRLSRYISGWDVIIH